MTGLTAPYEEPQNPELTIVTSQMSLENCLDQMVEFLIAEKIIFSKPAKAAYPLAEAQNL